MSRNSYKSDINYKPLSLNRIKTIPFLVIYDSENSKISKPILYCATSTNKYTTVKPSSLTDQKHTGIIQDLQADGESAGAISGERSVKAYLY